MKKDLAETCLRYLDGDLSADELKAFERMVVDRPEVADLLSKLALDEQHYRVTPYEQEGDVLPELLRLELSAEPELRHVGADGLPVALCEADSVDYRGTLEVLRDRGFWGYAGRLAMHSRQVRRVAVVSGVAAVVVLAVTVLFLVNSGPTQQSPEFAGFTEGPDETVEPAVEAEPDAEVGPAPVVATLTGSVDARWQSDEGAIQLLVGSRFSALDRLTLAEGFAELTTRRGARVLLEAPCSIEFTDNDNAVHLLDGKLLGICETEASEGFLVTTPSMAVTDLGTRFGVAHGEADGSLIHVFDGKVRTEPGIPTRVPLPVRELLAGESQAVDQSGQEIERRAAASAVFAGLAQRAEGVTGLSGQVRWADALDYLGVDPTSWPDLNQAVVLKERRRVTLAQPLELSNASLAQRSQASVIDAGTTVSSYILLYNPGQASPAMARGSVVFEGEVLGVVIGDQWDASLGVLSGGGGPAMLSLFDRQGAIEQYDADVIDLKPDGRTLAFMLKAGIAHDSVRIIVREPVRQTD